MKEWKNGDVCEVEDYKGIWTYGCNVPGSLDNCIVFRYEGSSHMVISKSRLVEHKTAEEKAVEQRAALIEMACLSYRHDFGLMSDITKSSLRVLAMEWLEAFEKHADIKIKEDLCK